MIVNNELSDNFLAQNAQKWQNSLRWLKAREMIMWLHWKELRERLIRTFIIFKDIFVLWKGDYYDEKDE